MSGVTAGSFAAYASAAAAAYSIYTTATMKAPQLPDLTGLRPPSLNDATSGDNAENDRRRRIAAARSVINPTGGLGDISMPSLSAKSLLGA